MNLKSKKLEKTKSIIILVSSGIWSTVASENLYVSEQKLQKSTLWKWLVCLVLFIGNKMLNNCRAFTKMCLAQLLQLRRS